MICLLIVNADKLCIPRAIAANSAEYRFYSCLHPVVCESVIGGFPGGSSPCMATPIPTRLFLPEDVVAIEIWNLAWSDSVCHGKG